MPRTPSRTATEIAANTANTMRFGQGVDAMVEKLDKLTSSNNYDALKLCHLAAR
jgi:hypothetical protein